MKKAESQAHCVEKSKKKAQKKCKIRKISAKSAVFSSNLSKNHLPMQKREKISSKTSGAAFSPVIVPRS